MFFEAVHVQSLHREAGLIPDLESYIDIRRDESGCKPCFDLTEYALGIDLPDFVIEHPVSTAFRQVAVVACAVLIIDPDQVIRALKQGSNDLVTWSNVSCLLT